ncbi:Inosine-uridine nucleoside N-ribohydrolase [Anaerocolumna jejuensis DSM 15929]|uniref:Inosine-uridine nucleoside N-ribohydrolase n=1 Tax=Anaerocolumna jejuensis DSM 15929 TaxID=1121322 RepID=A0A1M6UUN5_9FIRM|nr:nucleoside hydrolase [Anaerocolumna jejuensis]SHK72939.1 Inosine-uridine nucleoside N-ribohydrolase [Anaerocolumna jejuensis DSM 15929]
MDSIKLLKRLEKPKGKIDVVIDTDTFNEIDDQYALSYLIKSEDKLNLKAIYAAPFFNEKSEGPEDGMEKSYQEIMKVLELCGREDYEKLTFKGSGNYLADEEQAVDSPAARNLAELAMEREEENPLYVVAIGAITNVASAILLKPEIIERIVLVWLGGNAHDWTDNKEFNLYQDIAAARVVFGCGVPLVQLPCAGVVSSFRTTGPELEYWLKGKNRLCNYLVETTVQEAEKMEESSCWSRVIWDVTAVAWLLDGDFMLDRIEYSPIPEYDHHYAFDKTRHIIRYVYSINRDKLFEHLFRTLAK